MAQYGFFFDESRCCNCHACVVACRDWNNIEPGPVKWLRVLQREEGYFPQARMRTAFVNCYHCQEPLCIDACDNDALFKEDQFGAVLLDTDRCKGSRDCWQACPYGSPQFEDDAPGTPMSKCDMCYERLLEGDLPICVAACPTRALDFGPLEEMEKRYGTVHELEGMPSASVTDPAIVFKSINPRKQLVPYDENEALKLMQKRTPGLPDVYETIEQVTEIPEGTVGYDRFVFKGKNVAETLAYSKNEEG